MDDDECKCLELHLAVAEVGAKMGLETNSLAGAEEIISTTTIVVFGRRVAVLSEHAEDA